MTSYHSSTVDKAIDILRVLADERRSMTSLEVSEAAGFDRSTTHRLLATLERRELVRRDGASRRFMLGPAISYLALAGGPDLRVAVQPLLHRLVARSGESASFSIPHRGTFFCVAHLRAPQELSYSPIAGMSYPLNSGASGWAIWAFLAEDEREHWIGAGDRAAFTAVTITDPAAIRAELQATRQRGFGVSAGARTPGGCSVACPVLTEDGAVMGALALSSAEVRMPLERLVEFVDPLRAEALELAVAMRWTGAALVAGDAASD